MTGDGWPPSGNGPGPLERPQAHQQPNEEYYEPPGSEAELDELRALMAEDEEGEVGYVG